MKRWFSVAMTAETEEELRVQLVRPDGQEDLCFGTWSPSSGNDRLTALIGSPVLPHPGERRVHGNASFEMDYALRAAGEAAQAGTGLVFAHSHPRARGWQAIGGVDRAAEASIANLAREITGYPLVGLTLASGDLSWSGRLWSRGKGQAVSCTEARTVRVVGDRLTVSFNERQEPAPTFDVSQARTLSAWGDAIQSRLARLRVLVVGAGSVGMLVAERLARTGIRHLGVMDHQTVEVVNLDRLVGTRTTDAGLLRSKTAIAGRVISEASPAVNSGIETWGLSICEPRGMSHALDFDLAISCVDRPWPRHVLNTIAYADLIPVIDGGLSVSRLPDGGLRNAYWRSHTAMPGRPCLACLGQYDPALVQVERDGSLDSAEYIGRLPAESPLRVNQNAAIFSAASASALLNQFLSLVVAPSGMGDPGPLMHSLATHTIDREEVSCVHNCPYSGDIGVGDRRVDPSGPHLAAEAVRRTRADVGLKLKVLRWADNTVRGVDSILDRYFRRRIR